MAGSGWDRAETMAAPLAGIRIIEMAGIGPGPFAGMMLADHGCDVVRVERIGSPHDLSKDPLSRSRRAIAVDLKNPDGLTVVRDLARAADGLIDVYRPGVLERLGLGPAVLLNANPALVYGRMTGWGQHGPLAQSAGHDINYAALSGTLHACGREGEKPTPPVNLLADFGGGGMMLAFGMVSAILHARATGEGQVVDCAMVDGAALLMSMFWGWSAQGMWRDERGVNMLDTGAHFYDTYVCADGKFVAVGAVEPQFYTELLARAGLSDEPAFDAQMDRRAWKPLKARLASIFRTKSRDDWCELMTGDACVTPVLSMQEAPRHAHNVARGTFVEAGGVIQPAPAPRYSRSTCMLPAMSLGETDTDALLASLSYSDERITALRASGAVA